MEELEKPFPRLELDPVELRRQQQRLLSELFGIRAEVPLLNHYELLHELGRGSMGVVYAAHDRRLDRKVAIKKLVVDDDPELRQRLVSEAQAMAKLAHPNVVPVYEIGEVEDTTFIVMAYVEGVSLRSWLAQAPRSRDEILAVFMAAGEGLAAAHAKGIVHRDFKPDNVMVGDDGLVRVMDFGVARSLQRRDDGVGPEAHENQLASMSMTQTGALVGTPAYMAPEQLRGSLADAASDQFGFCVALYEALYGVRPFMAETLLELRDVVERGELPPPPSAAEVPAWLRAIAVRGLASAAEHRFESMRALLGALAAGEHPRAPPQYVFVAHHGADKQLVLRLCEALLAHGVRTWLDVWEPDARARAHDLLEQAPALLVCHGPGGWPAGAELEQLLRARIERSPNSVWRVELPNASADPSPADWPALVTIGQVEPDHDDWDAEVARLAALIGIQRDRSRWLGDEARLAGVAADQLSPYRGLEAFRECDARWMFGREQETGELVERLRSGASRFLSVVGASGSGKSSLVMAGLCPALRHAVLGDDLVWQIGTLRPGARPCEALARALVELQATRGGSVVELGPLRQALLDDTTTLAAIVKEVVSANAEPPGQTRVLLVVDQLEELFTEAGLGRGRETPDAAAFLDNLIKATRGDTGLWVVSTLRADFVHRCLEVRALARVLHAGTYLVLPPMAKPQIRAAIEQPARRVGYQVDATLVAELVNGAAEQPGRLPLLQHVLRELWLRKDAEARALRYAAYERTGGLEGAIAVAADAALDQLRHDLGDQAEHVVRHVMTRLVHLGEVAHGDTRRRATRDELGVDEQTTRVLRAFVSEARVLVASEVGGVEVFELAHEALLREWTKLIDWLDADREALHLRQELAQGAEQYAAHQDPEYLWGKGRVDEARRVLAQSTVELVDDERMFLVRSHQRATKRERLVWISVASVMFVLIAFSGFSLYLAIQNQRQATHNQALAQSERSQRERADDGINAHKGLRATMLAHGRMDLEPLSLAIEALGAYGPPFVRPPPPEVYQGTLDALAMRGVIGPVAALDGHTRNVVAVVYSADGRSFATGSLDGSARVWDARSGQQLAVFDGHTRSVTSIAFSPDGSRLATASWDRSARVWDVRSGRQLAQLDGHRDDVVAVVFSPDGARVATASSDDSARVWDAASGELVAQLDGHEGNVSAVLFSPDGSRVATASHDATARIWDADSGARLLTLHGDHSRMLDLVFSPDGSRLVTCGYGAVARMWDVATGEQLASFDAHQSSVVAAVFSPDGSKLATASFDDTARVWDPNTGEQLASFEGHTDDVVALAFLGGSRLITGSSDATARVWDVGSGRELATLTGHTDGVLAVAAGVDGSRFATASGDSTVRLWALSSRVSRTRLDGHVGNVAALRYSPDGSRLASAGDDSSVRIWGPDLGAGKQLAVLEGHTSSVVALAFSPDGSRLASAGYDSTVRLWDVASGAPLAVFEGHGSYVVALAFSPDGSQLASASYDSTARIWGVQSHEQLAVFEGHGSYVVAVAFSPDGSKLATGSYDSTARVWDVHFGDQLAVLEGHGSYVVAVGFSPDGSTLASAGWDHDARVWDATSGSQLFALEGHRDRVNALAFSPDGAQLATASSDHEMRLWELGSGKLVQTFAGHTDDVVDLDFSPDGARIATASVDDSVRLWELSSGRQLATLAGHTGDVNQVVFAPDASYLASAGSDGSVRLWPMPATALRLACDRVAPYMQAAQVAQICARLP